VSEKINENYFYMLEFNRNVVSEKKTNAEKIREIRILNTQYLIPAAIPTSLPVINYLK